MGLMWQMPIPVACSLAVAAQGLAVSCGQCPLDTKGQVLHPGDAGAQAGLVAGMVQGVLSHLPGHYPAILVVYHDAADESEVLGPLRRVFPDAVLLPVRLPHFYYPGMRIEVDLYALSAPPVIRQTLGLSRISGGPLELVALRAADMAGAMGLLAGLDPSRLLSAQWFAADPAPHEWHPDPGGRVVLPRDAGVAAVLTLAPDPVQVSRTPGGAIKRTSGCFVWISAQGYGADLAAAAHQAMDALALDRQQNLTILKATTHYVGGSGPEDLHGNLAVRHARFPMPGPASTGVPVAGLAGGSLAIDMLGIVG
jgi:enamine deaminase RidA (YjgF/YER057c/UK114 family)